MRSDKVNYDVVVLGSGAAGKFLAWTSASQGKRAVMIERRYVGGSCPNIACLPSKNVIRSAEVANLVRRSGEFGISSGEMRVDMLAVRNRKRRMVSGLVAHHLDKYRESGAELIMGEGRFIGPKTLEVKATDGEVRTLRADMVVISTGSRARLDSTPGLAEAQPMTHVEALELDVLPPHVVVLGGGYVGLELAQALHRFGSRVTVIDRNDVLIHREDRDVSEALQDLFEDEGIELRLGRHVHRIEGRSGSSVRLHATHDGADEVIEGSHLLVAAGRTANTDGIGLETAGIERTDRGFVKVDERLRTTAAGVWAVGDCAGSPHFTHVAYDDFCVVRDNLAGIDRVTTGRLVPFCIFTDPELARVGLSESEATRLGIAYRLTKLPVSSVLRSLTLSETRGFLKALVAADSDRILGFTAFCPAAGEVMAIVQVAIAAGVPYTALRDAILTHPTMAEGLIELFGSVPARA